MNDQYGTPHNTPETEPAKRPALSLPASLILMLTVCGISGLFCLSPTALFSATLSSALFAVLLLLAKRPLALLTVPLSYLAALLFTSAPIGAITALGYVPAGAALAICIAKRKKCAPTVFWVTLCGLVTAVAALGTFLLVSYGSLVSGFTTLYGQIRENAFKTLEALLEDPALAASLQSVYQEYLLLLDDSFRITLYLLPGLTACTLFFFSWIAAKLARRFLRAFRAEKFYFRKYWRIYVSARWAKLFIGLTLLSVVISFFEGKIPDVLYYTAANLLLVFEPPVLMVGIRRILTLLKKLRQSGALPVYFAACTIFVLCLCCSAQYLFVALTYVGAFHAISKDKRKKMMASLSTEAAGAAMVPDEDMTEETTAAPKTPDTEENPAVEDVDASPAEDTASEDSHETDNEN